jgi:hypothetical protein
MRWPLVAIAVAVLLPAPAPAEAAGVEVLGARTGGEGPALTQGTVVWSLREDTRGVRVLARLLDGRSMTVGRASLSAADGELGGWTLAAAQGRVGLRVIPTPARSSVVFGGPFGGGPSRLRSAPLGAVMAVDRDFWAWSGGYVTLERVGERPRAVLTNDLGETRPLALPAGADPRTLAVRDATAAVVLNRDGVSREVAVIDLATAAVVRRVDLGDARGLDVTSLSLDAEGELALTGEGGDGSDALIWAPAGASRFEVVAIDDRFGLVQVAKGRIAFVAPGGRRESVRPVVLDPHSGAAPTVVFRRPRTRWSRSTTTAPASRGRRSTASSSPTPCPPHRG